MVTRAIHHLRAQIRVLQVQDSSDRCSSPGHHLCKRWRAPATPHGPQKAGEVQVPGPLSRTASRVLLRPRPLRARPRDPARSRSARHLVYTGRLERGLATVVRAKFQGLRTQTWGKGISAAWDSGPRPGCSPDLPRLVRAVLRASAHSRVPGWPGSSPLTRPGRELGGVVSFLREYFVRVRGCAPDNLGPRVLLLFPEGTE